MSHDLVFRPSAEPHLAFSHSPGCMFLTDIPDSPPSPPHQPSESSVDGEPSTNPNAELFPCCFQISHNPLLFSLASQRAVAKIRQLETIIGEDPGTHVQGVRSLGCFPDWNCVITGCQDVSSSGQIQNLFIRPNNYSLLNYY